MNEADLAAMRQLVKEASREGTGEALRRAGIDVDDPRASQADMLFLRQTRKGAEAMKGRMITVFLTAAMTAVIAAVWAGFKGALK
ncbi:hypothetical protein [Breoghania sp. JC706]|uniref:hypothetical protein n=1 Tax=Breoghania sp. JC706 TaxID=3117732 RepID=UPI0030091829